MEELTKYSLLNAGIILIVTIILLTTQFYTTTQLKKEIGQNLTEIKNNAEQTKQKLSTDITNLQTTMAAEDQRIQNELQGKVTNVETKLDITKKEQQKEIKTISGQLEESTTKLGLFEEQLKNVQIKSKDFSAIIQDVLKAVVTIRTDKGLGSGVIIDDSGYVLTNFHVIDGVTQAGLRTYDNKIYPVKIIGTETNSDLAVLKIEPETKLTALRFETTGINVGDKVIAVGNPAGLEFSVSEGIISSADRTGPNNVKYVQTDVPINPGNSGGPLVNIRSRIVGINTMKKEGMEGLGFAVHAEVAQRISDQIIAQYEAQQNNQ